MTPQAFERVLRDRMNKTRALLARKGTEYQRGEDRLSNFKKAAALLGIPPEAACMGFLAKHLVSISDLVADAGRGVSHPAPIWDEKIGDAVAYLVLLEALVMEGRSRASFQVATKALLDAAKGAGL